MTFAEPYVLILLLLLPLLGILLRKFVFKRAKHLSFRHIFRFVTIGLIILALASPLILQRVNSISLVFVLDQSQSIDEAGRQEAFSFIEDSIEKLGPDDQAGLIVFGENALVESLPSKDFRLSEIRTLVTKTATNIEKAISSALATVPEEGGGRIILLSDGNENQGRAEKAVGPAKAKDVPIFVYPLSKQLRDNEVFISDLKTPDSIRPGASYTFSLTINALKQSRALLRFYLDGEYRGEDRIELDPGSNTFRYTDVLHEGGLHYLETILDPSSDGISANNHFSRFIRVERPASVLYIHSESWRSESFLNALEAQKISVHRVLPFQMPETQIGLFSFDAVIIDNVPSFDFSYQEMETLESFVRNGGGLIMLGGDSSFGLGDYYKTPVERLLPVDMDVTTPMEMPSLSMVFLIDKSGSMGQTTKSGREKLDLVKEAVLSSVDILSPYAKVGLLSFDADYRWTVRPVQSGKKAEIHENLKDLISGGGTILYPALKEAFRMLGEEEAAVNHIIILSDGRTDQADFESLVRDISSEGITISTVAVGESADKKLLSHIAEWGGGRSYFTDDVQSVPGIFTSETSLITRGLIVEEAFVPVQEARIDALEGINVSEIPILEGFVLTYLKDGARSILSAPNGNPLLSEWRYGLGRTMAFSSDLGRRWGKSLPLWPDYQRFCGQLMRRLIPESSGETIDIIKLWKAGEIHLRIEAEDAKGNYLNMLKLKAAVLDPDGETVIREIRQTAPGSYELTFKAQDSGPYLISLEDFSENPRLEMRRIGISVPYSEEYRDLSTNYPLLERIAAKSGSGILTEGSAGSPSNRLFAQRESRSYPLQELYPWITFLALLLFTVNVFQRELRYSNRLKGVVDSVKTFFYKTLRGGRSSRYSELVFENSGRSKRASRIERESERQDELNRLYMAKLKRRGEIRESPM